MFITFSPSIADYNAMEVDQLAHCIVKDAFLQQAADLNQVIFGFQYCCHTSTLNMVRLNGFH